MRRILSSDTVSLQSKSQFIDTMNRTKRELLRWQLFGEKGKRYIESAQFIFFASFRRLDCLTKTCHAGVMN